MSLLYIQLQVQIFDLAYQGKSRELEMQRLSDENTAILYNISTLKSANHLGEKVLSQDSGMKFLDDEHVVKLMTPVHHPENLNLVANPDKKSFFADLFSLKSQAEAGPR